MMLSIKIVTVALTIGILSTTLFELHQSVSYLADAQNLAKALAVSDGVACVIMKANDKVKCFGMGGASLGYGDSDTRGDDPSDMGDNLTYVDLGSGRTAKKIDVGWQMSCAILDNDELKCWGDGSLGSLGQGNTDLLGDDPGEMGDDLPSIDLGLSGGIVPNSVCAGAGHVCLLMSDATVKCFGWNHKGQLGLGDKLPRGDEANEMGSNLPFVDLGSSATPTAVTCGIIHTCAVFDNFKMKCWGTGESGRLGYGDENNRGDNTGQMGDDLPFIDLGTGAKVLTASAGDAQTCAILDDYTLKCWGNGYAGQLGSGNQDNLGDGANEMGDDLAIVDVGSGVKVAKVSSGSYKTCIVTDTGGVKCFGLNEGGDLGLEMTDSIGDDPGEMGDNLPFVNLGTGLNVSYVGSAYQTCVLLTNDRVKCWGDNTDGILGYGDHIIRGDTAGTMGDALPYVSLSGTLAPTNSPTLNPTNSPTNKPTSTPSNAPSRNPTKPPSNTPTSKSPSTIPTELPTTSPTRPCDYFSAKICKYDFGCMWVKLDGKKQCVVFDCTVFNQGKCGKQRKRCKWNRKDAKCSFGKKSAIKIDN